MSTRKPVRFYGETIGDALTLPEAATLAKGRGVPVNPDLMASIIQYVGEGPTAFNVVRTAGERIP